MQRQSEHGPRRASDAIGVAGVLAVTLAAGLYQLAGGTLVGQDSATQFYPWYGFLGDQLRQGGVPEWNPYQFAGAPFAADPQSGWSYLPAMLIFGLLPLAAAVPAFLLAHLALAGLGTYALARSLGMPPAAGVVAAAAYELTGPVYGRSICCPAAMEVAAWTPTALLGVELAIRSRSWPARIGGWSVAGLALSQGLAAWLGQGSYYLLLATAGFIAYRTLVAPAFADAGRRERLRAAAMHGVAVMAVGFGFAAAGVLPRLDYVARSNVAGGEYAGTSDWAAKIGGATPASIADRLLFPNLHYPGTATLALALVALLMVRWRFAAPYFAFLAAAGMVLAAPRTTPVHALLYAVLPRFEELHRHWPERVSLVVFLAPALLAGAAVASLLDASERQRHRLPVVLAPIGAVLALRVIGAGVPAQAIVAAGAVALGLVVLVTVPTRPLQAAVPVLLVILITADLLLAGRATAANAPYGGFHRIDVMDYYATTGAAEFLQDRDAEEPTRYFGYDPALRTIQDGQVVLYRYQFAAPATKALLVNNRATILGLNDVQGYNPVQPRRYAEFVTALNGHPQDYHDANVYPAGLDSPLLDLLNARYVVVPANAPGARADLDWLIEHYRTVYQDPEVRILENPGALPRAWIVHEALQVEPGQALPLLAAGVVDPRETALIEEEPPPLAQPADPSVDRVTVVERGPDRLRLRVHAGAAGLVMLSETYDQGWSASLNGEDVPVLVADHVLRAVAVPAGTHTIELFYDSTPLRVGGAVTLGTIAAVFAGAVFTGWRPWRLGTPHRARRPRRRGWPVPTSASAIVRALGRAMIGRQGAR